MDNVHGGREKQEHVRSVRDLRQRPVLRRVHPLVRADTWSKANSRCACACFANVFGCSLTTGACASCTGCSVHGCTRKHLNPFAYFTEDGQKANWIFAQFGRSQADRVQRKTSRCEWSHLRIARVCSPTGMLLDRRCAWMCGTEVRHIPAIRKQVFFLPSGQSGSDESWMDERVADPQARLSSKIRMHHHRTN